MVDIRPATEDDLPDIANIWYETEIDGVADPSPPGNNPWLGYMLRTCRVAVATDPSHRLIGFAGARQDRALTVLTDCFVRPSNQSTGVGSALLDAVLPAGEPLATFASTDPRAVAAYTRRGMIPRWPAYYLTASTDRIRLPHHVATAVPGGDELLQRGDPDRAFWLELDGICLQSHEGAAVVTRRSPFGHSDPDVATIVASTAPTASRAAAMVIAAVAWCVEAGFPNVELQVAGTHFAFPLLLEAGFRITDVDTVCASDHRLLADPSRTASYGEPVAS